MPEYRKIMGLRETLAGAGSRIRDAITRMALVSVPDHPAHGGITGDVSPEEEDDSSDDADPEE
jgi:hypothetical protein